MIEGLKPYPAYKDSGVPWLGKVPEHWEVCAVRALTRPVKGKQPKALYSEEEAPVGAQPYLTMEYLRGHTGTAKVYYAQNSGLVTAVADDVLLLWDGANAGEFFTAKAGIVSSTAALLPITQHNKRYLYFILKQCEPWLRALSTGMGIPHVDGRLLKQMQICLPPLPEQTAIVRFLDYRDRRFRRSIRAKQKLIKLLEEYRQVLIHQAVTGKIDVRTGKPYPAYKDSGVPWLGQVPEHWEVMPVKRALRPQSCGNAAIKNTAAATPLDGYAPAFSASGQDVWLPRASHSGSALVLSAVGARCGKTFKADGQWGVVANTHILWPRTGQNRDYWWYVTNNEAWWDKAGAAQPFVRVSATLERCWVIPPQPEQTAVVEYLDAQTSKLGTAIAAARREIELLREYRERLIADVVTGKVDVREVAAQLPEEPPEEEAELMDMDEIAEGEATDDDAAAEALPEEGVEA